MLANLSMLPELMSCASLIQRRQRDAEHVNADISLMYTNFDVIIICSGKALISDLTTFASVGHASCSRFLTPLVH